MPIIGVIMWKSLIVLPFLLAGCATTWHKDGGSEAEFNRDRYQCQMEVASAYPTAMTQVNLTQGYQAPMRTNCQTYGNNTNCTTTPGAYTPPAQLAMDANSGARNQAMNSCLQARGYYTKR